MIIRDLNVKGIAILPREAEPNLVVNPDAELALPTCLQSFQTVARRHPQVVQSSCSVQQKKLSQGWANQAGRKLSGFSCQPQ
jgi:hypothetical protein